VEIGISLMAANGLWQDLSNSDLAKGDIFCTLFGSVIYLFCVYIQGPSENAYQIQHQRQCNFKKENVQPIANPKCNNSPYHPYLSRRLGISFIKI
jgi:hypothetical protein